MEPHRSVPASKPISSLALVLSFAIMALLSTSATAQDTPSFQSTEVHADRTVTFRYHDPNATKVGVHVDGMKDPIAMEKGANGIWSATTPALAPNIYGYEFEVDGRGELDPKNSAVTPNLLFRSNMVTVPGDTPQLWDSRDVPHGVVHHHFYTSKVVKGLPNGQSDYYVYTPPQYDAKRKKPYPVLYLLHGWSDMANGWTAVGQANYILDNLIADGKAVPMVIVMPLGYGEMSFVLGHEAWNDNGAVNRNVSLFSEALLTEVLPRVESGYRVAKDRNGRAITGLSMGGLESLTVGLTHPDKFAWVGGLSSALGHDEQKQLGDLNPKTANLRLLWIACGTEDDLITPNRQGIEWLKSKGFAVTAIETPGLHNWLVWKDNLSHLAPLLFQK
jgi:enterochelin esterase family protein